MARIINGELTGKIGNMVAYRGEHSGFRRLPKPVRAFSEKQRLHQSHFGLVSSWLRPINGFLKRGLSRSEDGKKGQVAAVSQVFASALVRNGYDSHIDPSMVQVSWGPVSLPVELSASLGPDRQLILEWSTEVDYLSHPKDSIMILAYNIAAGEATWNFSAGPRKAGTAQLDLSLMPLGEFHIWAAFRAYGEEINSRSEYVGKLNVAASP